MKNQLGQKIKTPIVAIENNEHYSGINSSKTVLFRDKD